MGYTVKVDYPNLPRGAEVEIPGLGVVANGDSRDVTDEEAEAYRSYHGRMVDVEDNRPEGVGPTGAAAVEFQQGPTLLEAFKDHGYVVVEAVKAKAESAPKVATKPKE